MLWADRGQIGQLLKDIGSAWSEDNLPPLGASFIYYTALSLAPLLLVVLAVAGLAFGKQAVQGEWCGKSGMPPANKTRASSRT